MGKGWASGRVETSPALPGLLKSTDAGGNASSFQKEALVAEMGVQTSYHPSCLSFTFILPY